VLAGGELEPSVAAVTALVFGGIGVGAALVLALGGLAGPLALPMIVLALFLALQYSAPPLMLHSRGLGELAAGLILMGLTPILGYYLQSGVLRLRPLAALLPLALLQVNMMLLVHLPDERSDRTVGKRTLIVRLGAARAMSLHNWLLIVTYLSLVPLLWAGIHPLVIAGLLVPAPIALWQAWRLARGDWRRPAGWSSLVFWSITLAVGSGMAEGIGYVLLALCR
jgi:1,4-dihydroxy-2-naphthoate octaprenyltransferase